MNSLLIVAHGSRRRASNEEVVELAQRLQVNLQGHYAVVKACFLEIAEPSIPEAIRSCIRQGASVVTVLPYFLSAGRHVYEDIPNEVQIVRNEFPMLRIEITPHIGSSPEMLGLIRSMV